MFIMKSAGGLVSPEIAAAEPVRIVESGPAAGVLLAAAIGFVVILTVALSLHGSVRTADAIATVTTPNPPAEYGTKEGWSDFASGFWVCAQVHKTACTLP